MSDWPRYERLALELQRGQANRQWMLDVISTLTNGTHYYFSKGFIPPPKVAN